MDQIIRIGMDTSKHVFQLHGVNAAEELVLRKKLRRQDLITFFGKLPPTVVALEACGGSHHWARVLQSLGHCCINLGRVIQSGQSRSRPVVSV